jgi:NADH-quinone oxidoreductase subunit J
MMNLTFYLAGAIALISTALAITRMNAIHALLYVIVSLISVAVVFFTLGAPFVAALEVIIYAGAIMVLFVFVVMMLNLNPASAVLERQLFTGRSWIGAAILAAVLVIEMIYLLAQGGRLTTGAAMQDPRQVSIALFGPYVVGIELAAFLLLAGLLGAFHIGRREEG